MSWWRRFKCRIGEHVPIKNDYKEMRYTKCDCCGSLDGPVKWIRGYSHCKHCGEQFGWWVWGGPCA